jgi:hypothetical protein
MQIDPLETIITWLEDKLTSVNGRVAGKHRYGGTWTESQTGVSVHLDGGAVDHYVTVALPRLELRIYADDQAKVVTTWMALIALSRNNSRFTVDTSKGKALVHYFLPASGLSMLYDDVLKKDMGVVFFECKMSEEAVTN